MKRSDIQVGPVYGYSQQSGQHRVYRYDAVLVLSTDLFMIDRYSHVLTPADEQHKTITTGRASYGNAVGLLIVKLTDKGLAHIDTVRDLATVSGAMAGINGEGRDITLPRGLAVLGTYALLTRQRYLHGDYAELVAQIAEADRQRQTYAQQHEDERLADLARYRALDARLSALGITGYAVRDYESPRRFEKLTFDDMDELLNLAESAVRANKAAGIGQNLLDHGIYP